MRQKFIDDSMTADQKIAKLTQITERLSRRSVKHSVAIIPPIPVSNCVTGEDISGDILKYMFPAGGSIDKIIVHLGSKPKEVVTLGISKVNDLGGNSKAFVIDKAKYISNTPLKVESFDRLTISIKGDGITEVWIAFLWTPRIKESTVQQHLIDKLDEVSNDLSGSEDE